MPNPQKVKCRVEKVIYHTESVSTVILLPLRGIPKFKAGQFLHFTLDDFDSSEGFWPESRVFSIASSPSDGTIRIVYSVKGRYTQRMFNEIQEGKEYWIKLPYGHFTIGDDEKSVILVAGGTGITPFIPFLLSEADRKSDRDISLFYGFRERRLCIFENEISNIYKLCPNLSLTLNCEECEYVIRDGIISYKGIIDKTKILEKAINKNSKIYLSGPQPMIDEFKKFFIDNKISKERIKTDEWE